jgi:hypothetical protein
MALVNARFAHHPGSLDTFGWPVTRAQALQVLHEFVAHRLPSFGLYQDAMWEGEVWLYHSHFSSSLNLKLKVFVVKNIFFILLFCKALLPILQLVTYILLIIHYILIRFLIIIFLLLLLD